MSGYRAPPLAVAALITRHRAGAMAFPSDRFREYRLVLVPSLAELLGVAAAFLVAPRSRFLPDEGLPATAAGEGDQAV